MANVQLVGDVNDAVPAGAITSSLQSVVRVDGIAISVDGSPVSPHHNSPTRHNSETTANGVSNVLINGVPVNITGNADTCGHLRVGGNSMIQIG